MSLFKTSLIKKHPDNDSRVTKLKTFHGEFITPAFMPVGTRAGVNCMTPTELQASGSQIILGGNTYHMLVSPGMEVIEKAGGMHPFMGWNGPMLTDSGGFQVFSLSKNDKLCLIDEDGAHFKLPHSDKIVDMSPEVSLATQKSIGADIIMAFDQCTPDRFDEKEARMVMERTHRWLKRSKEYHEQTPHSTYGYPQALFGIIQGGSHQRLREQSTEFVVELDFDGFAIGGETIGFDMKKTVEVIDWVRPMLPIEKTRYSMGVGLSPQDLLDVIKVGIDIFDCVAPTRNARHGALYSGRFVYHNNWLSFESEKDNGYIQIKRQEFALDENPLMEDCPCYTCQNYSRAALHYLCKQRSNLYASLGSIHNVTVMHETCRRARELILTTS